MWGGDVGKRDRGELSNPPGQGPVSSSSCALCSPTGVAAVGEGWEAGRGEGPRPGGGSVPGRKGL